MGGGMTERYSSVSSDQQNNEQLSSLMVQGEASVENLLGRIENTMQYTILSASAAAPLCQSVRSFRADYNRLLQLQRELLRSSDERIEKANNINEVEKLLGEIIPKMCAGCFE
jgi:hypothetical protein